MNKSSGDTNVDDHSQLDAAAILLSLKTTPPSFPKKFSNQPGNGEAAKGNTTGYIPIYDWTQAIPSLSYAGNTYNINLQMYNSPVRLVPVPLNEQNSNSYKEMSIAFVKFCQIHRDTILLHNPSLSADKVNEKLVQLWTHLPDDEKVVYSKVAKNEILLMQGKDISSSSSHIKVEQSAHDNNQILHQSMEKCSPSLFRHPMCATTESSKHEVSGPQKNSKQKPPPSPTAKPARIGKQRSLSLSEKPVHKIYIRRTVSQEEVSNKDNFAKPDLPENSCNKKYLVRMRRHSMNDSILTSTVEKINPYFTKSYTRSPHKVRNDYTKTTYSTHSPKRNISVTSFDTDSNTMMKSPPKKNKSLPVEADIFDFKSEPHGVQVKSEPDSDEYSSEDLRKTETYSYSLLKGASKTSSVNPCFSSRKTFVKKINSIPSKCVNRLKQEYCSKKGKSSGCGNNEKQTLSELSFKQALTGSSPSQRSFDKHHVVQNVQSNGKFNQNLIQKELQQRNNLAAGNSSKLMSHCTVTRHQTSAMNSQKISSAGSPTMSMATSDVTMVTSSSMESLKSGTSSSSGESSKMELLNDSALLSYAIAELESAEVCKLKSSRRSQASGSQTSPNTRYRYVYNFFREHGLNPTQEEVNEFYAAHRDAFSCKSAAYLTIREVKQKIIKLQLM